VKVGGLLAGKDYYTGVVDHWPGGSQVVFVRDAVDEFAARKGARVYSTYTDRPARRQSTLLVYSEVLKCQYIGIATHPVIVLCLD